MKTHLIFDLLAYATSAGIIAATVNWLRTSRRRLPEGFGFFYFVIASTGVVIGSVLLGSFNLFLMAEQPYLAKSVLGGLLGGIVAVELMKWRFGIKGSTGSVMVVGLCFGIAVGRIGCFYGGLEDHTAGIVTTSPVGVDFGDGLTRYPVQLFESATMLFLGLVSLLLFFSHKRWMLDYGFYLFCGAYAMQRFIWEFLKPYPDVVISLNVFQLACIVLLGYALTMSLNTRFAATRSHYERAPSQ